MFNKKETLGYVVETCRNVLTKLGSEHKISIPRLRIDLGSLDAKPIFALFDQSTFITKCSLKEVIHSGGGKGMAMLLGVYIKNLIRDIFSSTLKELGVEDTKRMFVLLHLSETDEVTIPMISIYLDGKSLQCSEIENAVSISNNEEK